MYEFTLKKADPELKKLGIHTDELRHDYAASADHLNTCMATGDEAGYFKAMRWMAEQDLFFLCYFILDLPVNDPFLIARIYEVQNKHHFTVDLWSREHFKSSILSYALTIWQLIHNPEERICIFSHTRVMAKNHLRRIKQTLEQNTILHRAFPDIFFANPSKDSPKWSEDEGIYVRRKKNFAEASIEAWGLIDSSPIGKHYSTLVYDDLVTEKSVTSAEQIRKATEAFKLSQNLGTRTGIKRVIGTRYSAKDPYGEILKSKKWKPRIYPAEVDEEGLRKRGGTPVYLREDELNEKYDTQGEYIYSSQMLQDPVAASLQGFKEYWLKYWQSERPYMNYYIVVDPATTKKKDSDYTVMAVIGTDALRNYWLVDMVRDKLNLGERWSRLRDLVLSWDIKDVGYEQAGMLTDVEYMNQMMEENGIYFNIIPLAARTAKTDRIKRLVPLFQTGRFIVPRTLLYEDIAGETQDLTEAFVTDEYLAFPYGVHDDMLDSISRILDSDMGVTFPTRTTAERTVWDGNDPLNLRSTPTGSWMAV